MLLSRSTMLLARLLFGDGDQIVHEPFSSFVSLFPPPLPFPFRYVLPLNCRAIWCLISLLPLQVPIGHCYASPQWMGCR